jgi:hypothetical protein
MSLGFGRCSIAAVVAATFAGGAPALAAPETEVTVGSNDLVFSQNKQNEPAVAINPVRPTVLAAGANDNIDLEACNVGADNTCPFTPGVGVSGVQFSMSGGTSWMQPTYTGYSARNCLGVPGPSDTCAPNPQGPIGTLPWYFENRLVSNGDPVVAFGPRPASNGTFSWANGGRLYYQNITTNFPAQRSDLAFKGQGAIGVSFTDDPTSAAAGNKAAWRPPVLISGKLSTTTFSDKNWLAADDAESSPYFGNVYGCWVAFRSVGGAPEPVMVSRSTDGGVTWGPHRQISSAANPPTGLGRQGCQLDTDSEGVVYLVYNGGVPSPGPVKRQAILLSRSFDGGRSWERPRPVAPVTECGIFDAASGRLTFDGIAGARTNSFPSLSIANGAPSGADATDAVALTFCDGPTPSAAGGAPERAPVYVSTNGGASFAHTGDAAAAGDRPDFPALAFSPDGTDLYVTYMAFHQPWQTTTAAPRMFEGVVRHRSGITGTFSEVHRGAPGDARASSANGLTAEFLGDYNDVDATRAGAVAVWNDARNALDCAAIDAYRQANYEFMTGGATPTAGEQLAVPRPGSSPTPPKDAGTPPTAPAPQVVCDPPDPQTTLFGNTDIYAATVADPTP